MMPTNVKPEPTDRQADQPTTHAGEFRSYLLLERETLLKRLGWIEETLGLQRTKPPSHKKESRG